MTVGHVTWVIVLDGPSINVLEPLGVNNVNVGDNKVKQVLIILVSSSIRSCLQITYDVKWKRLGLPLLPIDRKIHIPKERLAFDIVDNFTLLG